MFSNDYWDHVLRSYERVISARGFEHDTNEPYSFEVDESIQGHKNVDKGNFHCIPFPNTVGS